MTDVHSNPISESAISDKAHNTGSQAAPLFSVVIPTCQRNDFLKRCLRSVCEQVEKFPAGHCEVLVSDDGREKTAKEMIGLSFPKVQWIEGPRRGPAANRNNGASHARGEWLLFLDDDCIADEGWLEAIQKAAAADPGLSVIEGKTICPGKRDTPFEEHVENLVGGVFWSCNMAVRRTAFFQIGAFDTQFLEAGGEDMEFAWRLEKYDLHSVFVPGYQAIHPPRPLGLKKLWWRTFMIRWILLYRLKTTGAVVRPASSIQIVAELVGDRVLELLRTTSHVITRFDGANWRRQSFNQAWKWITFPIVLPYLIYWEFQFRDLVSRDHK